MDSTGKVIFILRPHDCFRSNYRRLLTRVFTSFLYFVLSFLSPPFLLFISQSSTLLPPSPLHLLRLLLVFSFLCFSLLSEQTMLDPFFPVFFVCSVLSSTFGTNPCTNDSVRVELVDFVLLDVIVVAVVVLNETQHLRS